MSNSINLLPHDHTSAFRLTLALGIGQLFLVILTVGLLVWTGWLTQDTRQTATEAINKTKDRTALKSELERANALQGELAYITDRQGAITTLKENDRQYSRLIATLAGAAPASLKITKFSHEKEDEISISGLAAQRGEITTFIERLNQSQILTGATLTQANSQTEGVVFSLTAKPIEQSKKGAASATASPSPEAQ